MNLFLRFCGVSLLAFALVLIFGYANSGIFSVFYSSGGSNGMIILFILTLLVDLAVSLALLLLVSPLFIKLVDNKPQVAVIPISMVFYHGISNIDGYFLPWFSSGHRFNLLCSPLADGMGLYTIIMCFAFALIVLLLEPKESGKPLLANVLKVQFRLTRGERMTQKDCYIAGALLMFFFPWAAQPALNLLFRTLFNPPEWIILQSQYRVDSTITCFVLLYILEAILLYTAKSRFWVWLLTLVASFVYCVFVAVNYWISID